MPKQEMVIYKFSLFTIFFYFFADSCYSQNNISAGVMSFTQENFSNYKIDHGVYDFWWHENNLIQEHDTLPYFVDNRNYKGILNYGIEISFVNKTSFTFIENQEMYYLNVVINKCNFSRNDSIINIQGIVTGGYSIEYGRDFNQKEKNINIFIGNKKDTITLLHYYNNRDPKKFLVTHKGDQVINSVILDTFPSFYMYDYTRYKTLNQDKRHFEIKAKINENSILSFGLNYCYSEIFEIGKMVFDSTKRKKSLSTNNFAPNEPFKTIILNNVQIAENNQYKNTKIYDYYKVVDEAENSILYKQYGKAHKIYDTLLNKYDYIFARDMHNAVRCAILARDYTKAFIWCEKLVLKGVDIDYFNAKIFDRIKKEFGWEKFLKDFSVLNEKYKLGLNHELINGINTLLKIDQLEYVKNKNGSIEKSQLSKTTEFIDNEFLNLINKEGFPTEENIGASFKDKWISRNPIYLVLLVHSYQMNRRNFEKIQEVLKQNINGFKYDFLRNDLETFIIGGNTCLKIYKGDLYNQKSCNLDERQIKKVTYRFENEHEFILDMGHVSIIPHEIHNDNETKELIEEQYNYVTKLTDDWFFYEN